MIANRTMGADDGGGADGGLKRRHSGEEALQLTPRLVPGEGEEGGEPDSGDDRGDDVGRAGRPHAQGLLQDADVLAVVIGHHGAVRRQQTSFAARPVAVRRRQVGSEGLVEIEARGREAATLLAQQIVVAHIGKPRLDPGLRRLRRGEVQVEGLLDGGKSRLGRVLELLFRGHSTPRYADRRSRPHPVIDDIFTNLPRKF